MPIKPFCKLCLDSKTISRRRGNELYSSEPCPDCSLPIFYELSAPLTIYERAALSTYRLLVRYETLHSGNCDSPTLYRQTLLRRLAVVLPLSGLPLLVAEGHLIAAQ